jgi:hypothetical protein
MRNKHVLIYTLFIILYFGVSSGCKKDVINGTNGYNSSIKTSIESAGLNCQTGGLRVDVGLDSNRNGTLDNSEINNTSYICNEAPQTYTAKVNQTGVMPPVATVINNSLNLSITFSRISQGHFKGILSQNLDLSKSILLSNSMGVLCKFESSNEITLDNACGVNAYCDEFSDLNLEIRVYE